MGHGKSGGLDTWGTKGPWSLGMGEAPVAFPSAGSLQGCTQRPPGLQEHCDV